MHSMFSGATSFNADLSKWDVSRVEKMNRMFYNVPTFNSDLSKWDVSSVRFMDGIFSLPETGPTPCHKVPV